MVTYQVEQWFDCRQEMSALWPAHWEEIAINRDAIKLDVDLDRYHDYAEKGSLHVVVARKEGLIIGYHISICSPHLHYKSTLHAFTDVYYISPKERAGFVGIKLFKEVEKSLKARGVVKIFTGTKLHLDMGRIFEHLGYTETERLYTKYIKDES